MKRPYFGKETCFWDHEIVQIFGCGALPFFVHDIEFLNGCVTYIFHRNKINGHLIWFKGNAFCGSRIVIEITFCQWYAHSLDLANSKWYSTRGFTLEYLQFGNGTQTSSLANGLYWDSVLGFVFIKLYFNWKECKSNVFGKLQNGVFEVKPAAGAEKMGYFGSKIRDFPFF